MDFKAALLARLLGDDAVNSIAADRGSWGLRPQGRVAPDYTLEMVSTNRGYSHDGAGASQAQWVQINCWALTAKEAQALADALPAALEPKAQIGGVAFDGAFLKSSHDAPPEDVAGQGAIFRVVSEFNIWWRKLEE